MNTKLHAVTNAEGRPFLFFMTAGQVSDCTGAAALLGSLPKAEWLQADRGYDADLFRKALKDKGIKPCIPGRKSRGKSIKNDKRTTSAATGSRSCSGGSRTGGGSPHATTDARSVRRRRVHCSRDHFRGCARRDWSPLSETVQREPPLRGRLCRSGVSVRLEAHQTDQPRERRGRLVQPLPDRSQPLAPGSRQVPRRQPKPYPGTRWKGGAWPVSHAASRLRG